MSVEERLFQKLKENFQPQKLEIVNESSFHRGHREASSSGESHFKVLIVSEKFQGLTKLQRHRKIYEILAEELKGPVHALSLITLTPHEVEK